MMLCDVMKAATLAKAEQMPVASRGLAMACRHVVAPAEREPETAVLGRYSFPELDGKFAAPLRGKHIIGLMMDGSVEVASKGHSKIVKRSRPATDMGRIKTTSWNGRRDSEMLVRELHQRPHTRPSHALPRVQRCGGSLLFPVALHWFDLQSGTLLVGSHGILVVLVGVYC